MAPPSREWSKFERTALLSLLCRGVHITGSQGPNDEPVMFGRSLLEQKKRGKKGKAVSQDKIYHDLTIALNHACYSRDGTDTIQKSDVIEMVEYILEDKEEAMRVIERQPFGRITRAMKRVFERGSGAVVRDKRQTKMRLREEHSISGLRPDRAEAADLDEGLTSNPTGIDMADSWGTGTNIDGSVHRDSNADFSWGTQNNNGPPRAATPGVMVDDDWGTGVAAAGPGTKSSDLKQPNENDRTAPSPNVSGKSHFVDDWGNAELTNSTQELVSQDDDGWGGFNATSVVATSKNIDSSSINTHQSSELNTYDAQVSFEPAQDLVDESEATLFLDSLNYAGIPSPDFFAPTAASTNTQNTNTAVSPADTTATSPPIDNTSTATLGKSPLDMNNSGINPQRLAMLAVRDENEDDIMNDEGIGAGTEARPEKGGRSGGNAAKNSNYMDLPFNRLDRRSERKD